MFYQLVGIANASFYDSQIRSSNQSSLEPTYDKTQVDIRLFNIPYCTSKRKTPPPPTAAHYNGTMQWHPAMGPRPLPESWSSPSPPPTTAHYNGTQQWHHVRSPKIGRHPHSTLQWHPTMAPSNGTTSTAPCNGTLVPRPIRQSGSSPSPLLEVRTPIAIAIWGKKHSNSHVAYNRWFRLPFYRMQEMPRGKFGRHMQTKTAKLSCFVYDF